MAAHDLPHRSGPRPRTTSPTRERPLPHQQLDQRAPVDVREELFERASQLPGVRVGRSLVSLPESRAFHLEDRTTAPAHESRGVAPWPGT